MDEMTISDIWGGFSLLGGREAQCDLYRVLPWQEGLLILVIDGHGPDGAKAARMVHDHLPDALTTAQYAIGREPFAVRTAFRALDFLIELNCDGGACVTLIHVQPKVMFLAWVGDTQAKLTTRQTMFELNHEHHPDDPFERMRLDALGAHIVRRRIHVRPGVKPGIQVARSLGDGRYGELVSPDPDWKRIPLSRGMQHLLIGTDGLWNVIDDPMLATQTALSWLLGVAGHPVETLRREVHERGPIDNATGVLVDLRPFLPASSLS